jgi:hypothetical protein
MVTEIPGDFVAIRKFALRGCIFRNWLYDRGTIAPSGSTLFVGKTLMRLGVETMQAGDVGREHTASMRFTCLPRRHALSRHFTLRLRRPAPSRARIRASGRRLQPRWCMPNSMTLSTVSVRSTSTGKRKRGIHFSLGAGQGHSFEKASRPMESELSLACTTEEAE